MYASIDLNVFKKEILSSTVKSNFLNCEYNIGIKIEEFDSIFDGHIQRSTITIPIVILPYIYDNKLKDKLNSF